LLLVTVGKVTAIAGLPTVTAGTVTVAGLLTMVAGTVAVALVLEGAVAVALVVGGALVEAVAVALARLELAPGANTVRVLVLVPKGEVAFAVPLAPAPLEFTKELELLELLLKPGEVELDGEPA
jgi:hypothetical protein